MSSVPKHQLPPTTEPQIEQCRMTILKGGPSRKFHRCNHPLEKLDGQDSKPVLWCPLHNGLQQKKDLHRLHDQISWQSE